MMAERRQRRKISERKTTKKVTRERRETERSGKLLTQPKEVGPRWVRKKSSMRLSPELVSTELAHSEYIYTSRRLVSGRR